MLRSFIHDLILLQLASLISSIQLALDLNINQQYNLTSNNNGVADNMRHLLDQDIEINTKTQLITANISFGTPSQFFNLVYDTGIHQSWLVDSKISQFVKSAYNKTKSKTGIKIGGNYFLEDNLGYEIKEEIHFTSNGITTPIIGKELFSLILLFQLDKEKSFPYDGALGLNRQYDEKEISVEKKRRVYANYRFSIIGYLYNNEYIARKVFAHKAISKSKAILYLGETGTEEQNYQTCNSEIVSNFNKSSYKSYWHCYVSIIYNHNTGKKILDLSIEAVFDTNFDYIAFPVEKGTQLFEYLQLNGLIGCQKTWLLDLAHSLLCNEINRELLPDISFYISGFNITVTPDDYIREKLIITDDENNPQTVYQLKMLYNNYLSTSMVLGGYALMKQHMIFDYDNMSVGFIALKENVLKKNEQESNYNNGREDIQRLKFVMMCFIIMMSVIIVLCLINILFLRKKLGLRQQIYCR